MKKNNNKRERNESRGLRTVQAEGKKKKTRCTPFRVHSQKDKHHLICKRLPFGDDKKKKKANVAGRNTYMEIARSCAKNVCEFLSGLCLQLDSTAVWVLGFYKQCRGLG